MVSSVGNTAAATIPLASPPKPAANDPSLDFSQTVDDYLQNSSSGATASASSSNGTSQTLSDDLMSSLMQMQESLGA